MITTSVIVATLAMAFILGLGIVFGGVMKTLAWPITIFAIASVFKNVAKIQGVRDKIEEIKARAIIKKLSKN